jgi:hypothetical protein
MPTAGRVAVTQTRQVLRRFRPEMRAIRQSVRAATLSRKGSPPGSTASRAWEPLDRRSPRSMFRSLVLPFERNGPTASRCRDAPNPHFQ